MSKQILDDLEEPLTPEPMSSFRKTGAKGARLKKIFIIVGSIILIILASTYFFFFVIKAPKSLSMPQLPAQTKVKANVPLEQNTYLDMDPMTIGLAYNGTKREYLKIDLTIRLASAEESNMVMNKLPIVKDSLITFFRTLRSSDFNSSSSILYLKEEVTKRVNKIVAPIIVKEVLFQEITVN